MRYTRKKETRRAPRELNTTKNESQSLPTSTPLATHSSTSTHVSRWARITRLCRLAQLRSGRSGTTAIRCMCAGSITLLSCTAPPTMLLLRDAPQVTCTAVCFTLFTSKPGCCGVCVSHDHRSKTVNETVRFGVWNSATEEELGSIWLKYKDVKVHEICAASLLSGVE